MATHYGTVSLPFVSDPNYILYPYEIDTNLHPMFSFDGQTGWCLGPNATHIGNTTAPDKTQNAVIYQSVAADGSNCFVSQGWGSHWATNRIITVSVWAKLINDAGQPLSNVMNIARDSGFDRISVAQGEIKNYWKKFSITFRCGTDKSFYQAIFLFEAWKSGQQVALWGASLSY